MPARLGPMRLGVDGCVGYNARFPVLLVTRSTFRLQKGGIEGHGSSPTLPRPKHFHQVASQATDPPRQRVGQDLQAALEGAPGEEAPSLKKQPTHFSHISGVSSSRTASS